MRNIADLVMNKLENKSKSIGNLQHNTFLMRVFFKMASEFDIKMTEIR